MADIDRIDDLSPDPKELLKQYPEARETIEPLLALARVNPHLLEPILELAMVVAIHAHEIREARVKSYVSPYPSPFPKAGPDWWGWTK